ncbi:MAG: hypothetical protein IJ593_07600, partial [Lachnospiraceae bacterium]|nr:hypothetical protein [Lachnospiraceae bacterium]
MKNNNSFEFTNSAEVNAMVSLFKVIPETFENCSKERDCSILDCVKNGFIVVNHKNAPVGIHYNSFSIVRSVFGVNTAFNNNTFHKSFGTVANMSADEYFAHQIMHYFSTYGLEELGVDRTNIPAYIPVEELELPKGLINIDKLSVIRIADTKECVELIDKFLKNTVAPSKKSVELIKAVIGYATVNVDEIKSFELQILKHDIDGTVPSNNIQFLRYVVYKCTGSTLLIKNNELITGIKYNMYTGKSTAYDMFSKADLTKLAEIFHRYKPIFLAFKKHSKCGPVINKIRRLADTYHRPLSDEAIQNVINLALSGRNEAVDRLLDKATVRDLIKVYNSAMTKAFADNGTPGVYTVRNGKVFVRDAAYSNVNFAKYGRKFKRLINKISEAIEETGPEEIAGKTFYIPKGITYAAPYTEKQFIGAIPFGSSIDMPEDGNLTVGIHWFNTENSRVDIDLHMVGIKESYGWNTGYMNGTGNIIYSGDMTDAPKPNGAAEAFYIAKDNDDFLVSVNKFCGEDDTSFKFFATIGDDKDKIKNHKYTF